MWFVCARNIRVGAARCRKLRMRQRQRLMLHLFSLRVGSAGGGKGDVHHRLSGTPGSASRRSGEGPAGVTIVEDGARPVVNTEMQRLLRAPRWVCVMLYVILKLCLSGQLPHSVASAEAQLSRWEVNLQFSSALRRPWKEAHDHILLDVEDPRANRQLDLRRHKARFGFMSEAAVVRGPMWGRCSSHS